jgi:hypothetical protein
MQVGISVLKYAEASSFHAIEFNRFFGTVAVLAVLGVTVCSPVIAVLPGCRGLGVLNCCNFSVLAVR